ncbi:MAG: LON peptidase substrate-binding domain-containing protein [Planctomycetota bacterium]|jgi:Lon protease-like protein
MSLDVDEIRAGFPRDVPVFPLPNTILFPGALLPLHVFEPRYQAMVKDAREGDQLIAMALLLDCSRKEYEAKPPFHGTVCVGRIVQHEPLQKGRSNIILLGIAAGHAEATDTGTPYRTARVTLTDDVRDLDPHPEELLQRAFDAAGPHFIGLDQMAEQLGALLPASEVPDAIVGGCASAAEIPPVHKVELLEERSTQRRLERLLEFLERGWRWN